MLRANISRILFRFEQITHRVFFFDDLLKIYKCKKTDLKFIPTGGIFVAPVGISVYLYIS